MNYSVLYFALDAVALVARMAKCRPAVRFVDDSTSSACDALDPPDRVH